MEEGSEVRQLREEITKLKIRLSEIDPTEEPTSAVCGHDVALENLRKVCSTNGVSGLSQLLCFDERWGWYTTNLVPQSIEYHLGNQQTVGALLSELATPRVWSALTDLFHGQTVELDADTRAKLARYELIDDSKKLTLNGVMCYVVVGHLVFNLTLKLDVQKALIIQKELREAIGQTGETDEDASFEEFKDGLRTIRVLDLLYEQGINDQDLKKYYRQYRAPELRAVVHEDRTEANLPKDQQAEEP